MTVLSGEDARNHLISTDVSNFPSGNYLIRIIKNNKSDTTQRVIVAH